MNTRSNYGNRNSGGGGNYQSGRYNNPGTFIPAQQPAQQQQQQQQQQYGGQQQPGGPPRHASLGQGWATEAPSPNITPVKAAFQALPPATPIETDEAEAEVTPSEAGEGEEGGRKKWMKKGVAGFKVSMRERRRRQNRQLRRLITPKNALMVLNELTPGSQHECSVQPEAEAFAGSVTKQYVAVLNVEGIEYRGTGPSKLQAKNHAAEGVIRDMIIKQMGKIPEATTGASSTPSTPAASANSDDTEMKVDTPAGEEKEDEGPTFPMIQLASYALHKLFTDWQTEGFKVPSLGPNKVAPPGTGTETPASVVTPAPKAPRKPPVLPPCPEALHPCVLLSQMKGALVYSFLACEGVKPNGQIFSMGVTVDGTTYIGKAPNKKEARKLAAQRACESIYNITYIKSETKVPIEDM